MGRSIALRAISEEELAELQRLNRARRTEKRLAERVAIILMKYAGRGTFEIAQALGCDPDTVARWVKRFNAEGLAGLGDAAGRGRPLKYSQAARGELIATARTHPQALGLPFGAWTLDRLTAYVNGTLGIAISRAQLARVLEAEGLRWYQEQTYFTERPDPQFAVKRGR
ncbi:MAG: hypothetical protein BroJett018_21910 [Chloroflexota bacterium]|nr:helix-turn-helix domain-containing protein [Chloroflexota bacterium]NOG65482.1 helix-turn-helix domain containing protein [Chloroflexota bacterium]GIK64397.1 MAG: hypothetical protein BroJett018_21910 [Chloroflexota bacterium]